VTLPVGDIKSLQVGDWQFSQLPVGDINLYKSMSPTGGDFMSPTGNYPFILRNELHFIIFEESLLKYSGFRSGLTQVLSIILLFGAVD
jgi:hypothetical protein